MLRQEREFGAHTDERLITDQRQQQKAKPTVLCVTVLHIILWVTLLQDMTT